MRQADREAGRQDGLTTAEQEELRRLRRENRTLRDEREILKNAAAWCARQTISSRSKDSSSGPHRRPSIASPPWRVPGVAPSGSYAWRTRPLSARACADVELTARIQAIHRGMAMAAHLRTALVMDALDRALRSRRPPPVIHHADHGCQYTSVAFGLRCREAGVQPSMGSVNDDGGDTPGVGIPRPPTCRGWCMSEPRRRAFAQLRHDRRSGGGSLSP